MTKGTMLRVMIGVIVDRIRGIHKIKDMLMKRDISKLMIGLKMMIDWMRGRRREGLRRLNS